MAGRKRHARLLIAGALTLAMIAATSWVMASASTSTTAAAVPSLAAASSDLDGWVTLITGDRVLVRGTDGKANPLVERAPRSIPAAIIQYTRHGDRYVLPSDAAGLVRDGIVDEQLFNVTGLVRQGYDDAHTEPDQDEGGGRKVPARR